MSSSIRQPPRFRWVVLAVGAGATAALSAVQGGLPALGPAIQVTFGLSLVEVTAVFTAFALGTVLTLLAWGALSDHLGERWVIAGGLGAGSLALAAAASADGYASFLGAVVVAGMLGSSAISASGRAVFGWFPRDERGLALGLRQTAVPAGAAAAGRRARPAHLAAQLGVLAHDRRSGGAHLAARALALRRAWLVRRRRRAGAGRRAGGRRARARRPGAGPTCATSGSSRSAGLRPRRARCCSQRPPWRARPTRSLSLS